ncbi:formate dehydrogenase accessory protein FdhE [Rugamonas apoptosis]|uniref:Formate dehydrogenase accessory protein FdhE n=1 Tax=Rugamonas apoptosis TaxID=2758570 RepID=A0A7W2FCT1_9BURK|nr:formate dehydrogenase accessory protein FdhE [Rugamonas apoptosis]MBA5689353.1 formate dehydrogenase accessory protein FdhE [Rugamonas apoptosis]
MVQRLLAPGEIEALDHTAIPRLLLPQPRGLFRARAARLRRLANNDIKGIPVGATLRGYLLLMAALVDAQAAVTLALPSDTSALAAAINLPGHAAIAQALSHNMPPLPVSGARPRAWRGVFDNLLAQMGTLANSQPQLSSVLDELRALSDAELDGCADAVLAQFGDGINPLHAPFVAAALQVVWTLQASLLDARHVQPLVTGALCPVCGSHPVASVIRIGGQSQGYRYLHCGICASEWHMVRVKCSSCEQNAHVAYQSLEDADGGTAPPSDAINKANDPSRVARAETCDDCHSYRKIFNQEHDYEVEPLADDLASLMLDVLVGEAGYARASGNPLLWFSAP